MFDLYWNHPTALPAPAFLEELDDPEAALERLRAGLEASQEEILGTRYAAAVEARMLRYVEEDNALLYWAPYQMVVDSPDKGISEKADQAERITTPLQEAMQAADEKLVILSAYFVPLDSGVKFLAGLAARGVDVTVITNSLAANNQFTVHGGYAPSRKPLLEAGVRLYEVRPDAEIKGTEFIDATGAKATLHTKAFFVDGERVFIGSFNMDPRSARINTELGVMIDDPELAAEFAGFIEQGLRNQTYQVFLNEDNKLRWRAFEDGKEVIYDKEPQTTWGQRFMAVLARIIPAGQL
jgi:putative cardiolipin synthase